MKNLFKKTGVVFVIKILGLLIGFFFQFLLTNNLTVSSYGEYTLFLTYVNMMTIFSLLGLDNSLIKEIPLLKRAFGEKILKYFFKISLMSTALLSITYYMFFRTKYDSKFLIIVIVALFLKNSIGLLDAYFQGKGKIVEVNINSVLLNNILKVILFYFVREYKLYGVFFSYFISEIICLIVRLIQLKLKPINKVKVSKEKKQQLLKYGITFTLITSIGILNQNADKLILEKFLGLEALGIYKVSQNYLSLLGIFVSPFIAFWPVISKLYSQNKIKEIESTFSDIIKLILVLVIPSFIFIYFNSESLLGLFGAEYSKYSKVLIILSIGILIDTSAGPIGAVLSMTKYQKVTLFNSIFCLVLNIILSMIFLKKYGIIGVAFATTICIICNNLISIISNKILLDIMPYKIKILQVMFINLITLYLLYKELLINIRLENIILEFMLKLFFLGFVSLIINCIFYYNIIKEKIITK
ncbi:MAG: oligosaccharide flippase family protein [Fusobacteriaceae bacterium]